MTNEQEREEALLRDRYLEASRPDTPLQPAEDDDTIQGLISQANLGTGARDLIALAVSSLLALLLAITGPRSRPSGDEANKLPPSVEGQSKDDS